MSSAVRDPPLTELTSLWARDGNRRTIWEGGMSRVSEDASHVHVLGTGSQAGPPPRAEAGRWDEIGPVHMDGVCSLE